MNKVFELIEANKIFNIELRKLKILIHPKSYVHAIVKFKNGLTKMLVHDTNMKIPIFNSLFDNSLKTMNTKKFDLNLINNLNFSKVDSKKFPSVKIIKKIPKNISLYETVLVSANDELVDMFLKNKIQYNDIVKNLIKMINLNEFKKFKYIKPKNCDQIINLSKLVRLKTKSLSI